MRITFKPLVDRIEATLGLVKIVLEPGTYALLLEGHVYAGDWLGCLWDAQAQVVDYWRGGAVVQAELHAQDKAEQVHEQVQLVLEEGLCVLYKLPCLRVNPVRNHELMPVLDGLILLVLDGHPQVIIQLIQLIHQMLQRLPIIKYISLLLKQLIIIILKSEYLARLIVRPINNLDELLLLLQQMLLEFGSGRLQFGEREDGDGLVGLEDAAEAGEQGGG